jgi:hypothetical protein
MDAGTWLGVGIQIIDYFNASDRAGAQIDTTDRLVQNAIANLRDQPLSRFHEYLVKKANDQQSKEHLQILEAEPAGDER